MSSVAKWNSTHAYEFALFVTLPLKANKSPFSSSSQYSTVFDKKEQTTTRTLLAINRFSSLI